MKAIYYLRPFHISIRLNTIPVPLYIYLSTFRIYHLSTYCAAILAVRATSEDRWHRTYVRLLPAGKECLESI